MSLAIPMRTCNVCFLEAYTSWDLEKFVTSKKEIHGVSAICKYCSNKKKAKWRKENKEKHTETSNRHRIKKDYGVSLEEYNKCMETSVVCECCGGTKRLVYDHSHVTGDFRGVLCNTCNLAAGQLGDTAEGVYRMYKYLVDRGD